MKIKEDFRNEGPESGTGWTDPDTWWFQWENDPEPETFWDRRFASRMGVIKSQRVKDPMSASDIGVKAKVKYLEGQILG